MIEYPRMYPAQSSLILTSEHHHSLLAVCCPCAYRHVIFVEDAQQGINILKEAMKAASKSGLYQKIETNDDTEECRAADPINRT
jgi:hypothetical protein